MNLVIAANALGFGTSWLTEWFATTAACSMRSGWRRRELAGFVHIGRAARRRPSGRGPCWPSIVTHL